MTANGLLSSKPFHDICQPDPTRPILSALKAAELERLDRLFEIGNEFQKLDELKRHQETFKGLIDELGRILKEWNELMDWANPPAPPLSAERAMDYAIWMRSKGYPEQEWEKFFDNIRRRPKGRPITKRQVAIRALERRILEPSRKWSDRELAQQFCDCKKQRHDHKCSASLRQSIIQLKTILKKYCPELTL